MKNDVPQWFLSKPEKTGKLIVQPKVMNSTPYIKLVKVNNLDRSCRNKHSTIKKRIENYSNSIKKLDSLEYESLRGT
ncbi:hypothetical protein ATE84_5033 [Aquimarina sp. MAR_2010_214]|uniref:hypothetical protein n=1 Tax=Aquimarina sp. MAR_2010_214 TaxID=1250026 RepID=UPI000C70F636|nr:hypothetical protein [Aquimarina sp. MAR_2010_214]PKV52901.1 hypothetical protein ATE84_5033 [Aquimarina sp. MAR_2010_214]